jgi:predicted methyltransferase
MTSESLANQVFAVKDILQNKVVLHIGDDDHISALFGCHLNIKPIIAEYDSRIRKSLRASYKKFLISDFQIFKYDVREAMPKNVRADTFYINPPYSSKNNGKGAKVWISRSVKTVPVGSTSILVYPIDETLSWTLSCLQEILTFAYQCGLVVVGIDRDQHTYEYLPKDPGLLSSNIYLYKFADLEPPKIGDINGASLYR